ncbi:hypothetical protein KCU79_g38, partial [Aureobasidium melanogenum]
MRRTRYASDTKGDVRSRFHQYTSYITVESPTRNPIHTLADRSSRDHMIERHLSDIFKRQSHGFRHSKTLQQRHLTGENKVVMLERDLGVSGKSDRLCKSVDMADPASRYLGCQVGESRGMSYRPPRLSDWLGFLALKQLYLVQRLGKILLRDGKLFGKRWLVLRGFVGGVDVLLRRILADINAWLYFLEDEDHHLLMSICLRLLKACLGVPGQIW